jgi:hypothetical protein
MKTLELDLSKLSPDELSCMVRSIKWVTLSEEMKKFIVAVYETSSYGKRSIQRLLGYQPQLLVELYKSKHLTLKEVYKYFNPSRASFRITPELATEMSTAGIQLENCFQKTKYIEGKMEDMILTNILDFSKLPIDSAARVFYYSVTQSARYSSKTDRLIYLLNTKKIAISETRLQELVDALFSFTYSKLLKTSAGEAYPVAQLLAKEASSATSDLPGAIKKAFELGVKLGYKLHISPIPKTSYKDVAYSLHYATETDLALKNLKLLVSNNLLEPQKFLTDFLRNETYREYPGAIQAYEYLLSQIKIKGVQADSSKCINAIVNYWIKRKLPNQIEPAVRAGLYVSKHALASVQEYSAHTAAALLGLSAEVRSKAK